MTDEGAPIESDTNHSNIADDMAKEMIITEMRYYVQGQAWKVDLLNGDDYDNDYAVSSGESGPKVSDLNGDGKASLYELKAHGGIALRPPDAKTRLKMSIKFDKDTEKEFQRDMLHLAMEFPSALARSRHIFALAYSPDLSPQRLLIK